MRLEVIIFKLLLVGTTLYALTWGGAPERIGVILMVAAALGTYTVSGPDPVVNFSSVQTAVFVIDLILLLALGAVALASNRYWPLWVTAMQFVTMWSHVAFWSIAAKAPWAYAVASTIWAYPMMLFVALGTMRHRSRIEKWGDDPSWSRTFTRPKQV